MKTKLTSIAVAAGCLALLYATSVNATLLVSEPFSYADGSLRTVSGGAWVFARGSESGDIEVSGQQAIVDSVNQPTASDYLAFGGTHTNDVLYGSADINFRVAPVSAGYGIHFREIGTLYYAGRVWMQPFGDGGVRLGVAAGPNEGPSVTWPTSLSLNTTYQIAWKLDQSLPVRVMTLWVNPTSEADTSIISTDTSVYHNNLNSIVLREYYTGVFSVDNLMIGTTFADVIPEPSTMMLVGLSAVGLLAVIGRKKA